ncbi:hypothetical protein DWV39_08750 [Bifidobacterium longum]|uniref:hypothetical protein n=1 Tax=Bifidobacterium longum TaxID=216816 RepID=UPI000E4BA0F0|nr:hypothetical protein [Bifidobacterium longum]RGW97458.1 hypothetical protein DWV39_08750 [Bifidobacterium longum]
MSAVNELERRLDADRPHAGPDERTETFHEVKPDRPPSVRPTGGPRAAKTKTRPRDPWSPVPRPTRTEWRRALTPMILQLLGVLLLALAALAGWRAATWDWTPADTVMRGVDATRPVRVLRVIDPDDPETPVRVVHAGRRYAIWWLDADAMVRTGMLLTRPGLVSVATSDSTAVLPEGGGA